MKTETFHLELITPCFCGGAEPERQAEIRAPSIRGQLRWWFRTLGGFKSLEGKMPVREQEAMIFGSTAGDEGRAGKLVVRVQAVSVQATLKDGQELGHPNFSDPAYLTFPIQTREKQGKKVGYSGRGVLTKGTFDLSLLWRGESRLWEDIRAHVAIFGHLGALGFRGRRAMGALAFQKDPPELRPALERFAKPGNIVLKELNGPHAMTKPQCIPALAKWLKAWREHGRTPQLTLTQPGFDYARRDHNEGLRRLTGHAGGSNPPGHPPKGNDGETFRAALGLPIIQFFSSQPKGDPNKVNWEWDWNSARRKGEGRFASPVLLRPHRDPQGNWHALVIFVDAHQWPDDPKTGKPKQVFLNGQPRAVSLDLYEAMKHDPALKPFS
jgi:CRISPR type III-B/RAMP module RAMP protein Cmr1